MKSRPITLDPLMTVPPPRVNILGVGVHALNLSSTIAVLQTAIANRTMGYICVTGVPGVCEAQADPAFRSILNHALLNTPDGMPMVWIGKKAGHREMDRVYGPDLLLEVCAASETTGWRTFFYGGVPGTAESLAAVMSSHLELRDVSVMIGIGADFDLVSGKVRQSPRWIQRSGFEWLYRLIQEPRRLWKRYFKNNPLFVWRLFLQKSGLRRYTIENN